MGLMFGLTYAAYGVGFWYGNKLIVNYRWRKWRQGRGGILQG
jgi:hypothetical protein